tara:strand:- start:790 stop:1218 length:429 start_codon:yes stop_codon:yes gene_type:complete
MSYNTKNLFSNAAKNVARNFAYSEGEEIPRRKPRGPFEDTPERASRRSGAKDQSTIEKLKKAITDASETKGMDAYQQQLNLLTSAVRGAPKFKTISMGPRDPKMAGKSGFGAIREADPRGYLKENTNRMKQYALERIYIARK